MSADDKVLEVVGYGLRIGEVGQHAYLERACLRDGSCGQVVSGLRRDGCGKGCRSSWFSVCRASDVSFVCYDVSVGCCPYYVGKVAVCIGQLDVGYQVLRSQVYLCLLYLLSYGDGVGISVEGLYGCRIPVAYAVQDLSCAYVVVVYAHIVIHCALEVCVAVVAALAKIVHDGIANVLW